MKKKSMKKLEIPMNEIIDTGPSEIVEKFLDVSEIENEKNNSLVRIDINMIEYPLFTKSTSKKKNQIIRYFFNRSKEAYIQVNPTSGDYIPGELEERVFIALLKIMRDKRYSNTFYTTISEILTNMGIAQESFKGFYSRISKALIRLSQTSYTFKNSLYSNKIKGIIEEQINTNIMNIHTISFKQAQENEKELFSDRRIKEIIKVSISEHFYDNIIRKGYLVYDSQLLLSMDNPITRALYMLINKLRFNKMYIKVLSINLIKRIPLSENIQKIGRTIKIIKKSCEELKTMDLIEDYNIIKNSKWIESEVEFFFAERHNTLKQSYFYDDKNHFDNLLITHTDTGGDIPHDDNKQFEAVKAETVDRIPTTEKIENLYKILPNKAKELKTLPKVLKDGIRQFGYEYMIGVCKYITEKKVTNIRSYLIQALQNGWADDYILSLSKSTTKMAINEISNNNEIISQSPQIEEKENTIEVDNFINNLSSEELKEIESKTYKAYIEKCGFEGNLQKLAFNAAKNKLIRDYITENIDINNHINTIQMDNFTNEPKIDNISKLLSISTTETDNNINTNNTAEMDNNKTSLIEKISNKNNLLFENTTDTAIFKTEENTTQEDTNDIFIFKVYKNISMFQMEILDLLENENIKEVDKIIRLVSITNFFEGEIGNKHIKLEYNEGNESCIKIQVK